MTIQSNRPRTNAASARQMNSRTAPAIGAILWTLSWAPSSAWAAHADFTGLGYSMLGGAAGFVGGVALSLYLLPKRKPGFARGLLAFAQAIVGTLGMAFAGANIGALVYGVVKRTDQNRQVAEAAQYQNSPLKLAACSAADASSTAGARPRPQEAPAPWLPGSAATTTWLTQATPAPSLSSSASEVRRLIQDAPTPWLTRLALDCGLHGPARADVYFAAMERLKVQSPPKDVRSEYCAVLRASHHARAAPQLQTLIDAKLPWDCPGHDGTPGWWDALNDSADHERDLQWLGMLRKAGADFRLYTPIGGQILHRITQCGAPAMILMALEAGADPSRANPNGIGSPRVQWALRRHAPASESCAVDRLEHPLDRAAISRIDALIGALSAQDANQQASGGETPLFSIYGHTRQMTVLLRAGARIDIRSNNGRTFLHNAQKLDPEAIALLAAQPAEQLRSLGRPQPATGPDGRQPVESLLDVARKRGDKALENLLCANGADGC